MQFEYESSSRKSGPTTAQTRAVFARVFKIAVSGHCNQIGNRNTAEPRRRCSTSCLQFEPAHKSSCLTQSTWFNYVSVELKFILQSMNFHLLVNKELCLQCMSLKLQLIIILALKFSFFCHQIFFAHHKQMKNVGRQFI